VCVRLKECDIEESGKAADSPNNVRTVSGADSRLHQFDGEIAGGGIDAGGGITGGRVLGHGSSVPV
jgi:hypothetical protein